MNPWEALMAQNKARKARRRSQVVFNHRASQLASGAGRGLAGSAKPMPIAVTRTLVKKQLDHLCSLIVRRRDAKLYAGYCLICVTKRSLGLAVALRPIAVCYHIQPRGDEAVRWDLRNQIASCAPCNYAELMSRSRSVWRERTRQIHVAIIGADVLAELEAKARTIAKFSTANLISMRDQLKAQLEGRI